MLVGQSIGAAAALKVAVAHPERAAGVVLAHSLGGLDNPELAELVKADRAEAEKLPVLDRLMSKSFQESSPELTFLFRQMGTFNKAKMQDLRNLGSGGPTFETLDAAPFRSASSPARTTRDPAGDDPPRTRAPRPGSVLELVPDAPHSMYWERRRCSTPRSAVPSRRHRGRRSARLAARPLS